MNRQAAHSPPGRACPGIRRTGSAGKRTGELTLSILPSGTLSTYVGYGFEGLSTSDKLTVYVPAGVLIVLLLFATTVLALRRKNKKRRGGRPRQQRRNTHNNSNQHYASQHHSLHTPQRRSSVKQRQYGDGQEVVDLSRNRRR